MKTIEIIKPDDWHVHFRDNEILKAVVPETSRHFSRALVMPNLVPPVLSGSDALEYKKRIQDAIPFSDSFTPMMTIYLTEKTNKIELVQSFKDNLIFGAKLYPAGATTNSELGVKNINAIMPILETMAKIGMPLLIHGEVTETEVDIFDREKVFIDKILSLICKRLPELTVTLEHITTNDAVLFIQNGNENLAATITPHHLALNRNNLLVGGIKPHYYCLPILKKEPHRIALINAAISGNSKFFLGSDTAPHTLHTKETSCGCAGIFNAKYCMSVLAEIFDQNKSISNLERFTSLNGAKHYKIKTNTEKIRMIKRKIPIEIKNKLKYGKQTIVNFDPIFPLFWEVTK